MRRVTLRAPTTPALEGAHARLLGSLSLSASSMELKPALLQFFLGVRSSHEALLKSATRQGLPEQPLTKSTREDQCEMRTFRRDGCQLLVNLERYPSDPIGGHGELVGQRLDGCELF